MQLKVALKLFSLGRRSGGFVAHAGPVFPEALRTPKPKVSRQLNLTLNHHCLCLDTSISLSVPPSIPHRERKGASVFSLALHKADKHASATVSGRIAGHWRSDACPWPRRLADSIPQLRRRMSRLCTLRNLSAVCFALIFKSPRQNWPLDLT